VDGTGTGTGAGTVWLKALIVFGRHRDFMQENRINKGLGQPRRLTIGADKVYSAMHACPTL